MRVRHQARKLPGVRAPRPLFVRPAAGAVLLLALAAAGCSGMTGRATSPLSVARDEPGVLLCRSERTAGGGIRIAGKLNMGIYPIRRATIEYRIAEAGEDVPATRGGSRELELTAPRTEKAEFHKAASEVSFSIAPEAVRKLEDRVVWYRWIVEYDKGGGLRQGRTGIHRTSLAEAGLPRSGTSLGPDTSVGPTPLVGR